MPLKCINVSPPPRSGLRLWTDDCVGREEGVSFIFLGFMSGCMTSHSPNHRVYRFTLIVQHFLFRASPRFSRPKLLHQCYYTIFMCGPHSFLKRKCPPVFDCKTLCAWIIINSFFAGQHKRNNFSSIHTRVTGRTLCSFARELFSVHQLLSCSHLATPLTSDLCYCGPSPHPPPLTLTLTHNPMQHPLVVSCNQNEKEFLK